MWSVVAISQAALSGKASFYATRALLGALEGGFSKSSNSMRTTSRLTANAVPDLILWLSYFYKSKELTMRLSWFWISRYLTMVITSLMAYGLLHMRGVHGMEGWRWLFLVEGLITLAIGLASFFLMPASAVQTKTWFRPNGWFTDREVGIVVNRVLRDDPSKGDMHNRTGLSLKNLWDSIRDYDLWPVSTGCCPGKRAYADRWSPDLYRRLRFHDSSVYCRPVPDPDPASAGIQPGRPHH